jgi:DNA-binding IclR family transcriptional regulator
VNLKSEDSSSEEDVPIYMVPAVDRAARILLMLSTSAQGMTLAEIASATGWHKSSIHKILVTLGYHGFLERDEATKRYVLGIGLVRFGQSVLRNLGIHHSAKAFLKELAEYSGETATLAIVRGTKMVIVDVVESPIELRVSPPIGTMDSVTTKSNGKAVLAWLPEDRINEIIQTEGLPAKTRNSITMVKLYRNELASVREQGYAIDSEEFQEGISAVSAPIFNLEAQVLGTLSLVGPASRMTKEKLRLYGGKCVEAAARLSPLIR